MYSYFYIGDGPARLMEGGNVISGDYRCLCGTPVSSSSSTEKLFLRGKFSNLQQRIDHINKSPEYTIGRTADQMKVNAAICQFFKKY